MALEGRRAGLLVTVFGGVLTYSAAKEMIAPTPRPTAEEFMALSAPERIVVFGNALVEPFLDEILIAGITILAMGIAQLAVAGKKPYEW